MIILLNGTSSSGKTTLARALQQTWPGPLLYFGIDDLIGLMPYAYTGNGEHSERGIYVSLEPASEPFVLGAEGSQIAKHAAGFVADLAAAGFDLVLDFVLTSELLNILIDAFREHHTVFCGVRCDAVVLEAREQNRGDRLPGLAAKQLATVHRCEQLYDLDLDSAGKPADQLASEIITFIATESVTQGIGINA